MSTLPTADLELTQGLPFARGYRFLDATRAWPAGAGCEARAQTRWRAAGEVTYDLTPHLQLLVDGADIVVTLTLAGADTRLIPEGEHVYDLYLSDVGGIDQRARRVAGTCSVAVAITSAT